MALEAIDPRTFLTRSQLADALEQCGIPLSYDTLATKATRGGGPPFRIFGKSAVYQWCDVVAWVRETMGEPARTTSEHRARMALPPAPQRPSPEKLAAMMEGSRRYNAARVAARKASATLRSEVPRGPPGDAATLETAKPWEPAAGEGFGSFGSERGEGFSKNTWPEPKPIPDGLLPVAAFDPAFLPDAIAPWVMDIAERMQCPPDFVAIPAMVALGSVIGRKVAVRPQRKTDWYAVPNLWGCIVGRPGAMKSPAMDEALKPLHRLEAEARKANEAAAKDYEIAVETFKLRKEDGQKKSRPALKGGAGDISSLLATEEPEEPKARRYVVNDATYEALGVILADNPNGTLAFRDELVSLLKNLDREEQVSARGFFLTGWNGTTGYTFDRIIRGKTHIEAACLSLLGSTQPGRLAEYMRAAISGGAGDDGMVQRFSLLVWPDQSPSWENTDRYPASEPRAAAWQAFRRLDELTADAAGAATDEFAPVPYLRFDEDAQGVFNEWRKSHETRLRSGDLAPALESHLAKYRKLAPALALINHLADGGTGAISENAILRALAFVDYLETHARRAYGAGSEIESSAAKAILKHIRKGDVQDGFTARAIQRRGWGRLSDDALCALIGAQILINAETSKNID
jgi:hypothetical protein